MRVDPQAVELGPEPLTDQVQTGGERPRDRPGERRIGDQHYLGALGAALHHHLQIARKTQVGGVGVARHARFDERTPHYGRDVIDQRMMHSAVRHMDHAVRADAEQSDFGRPNAAADREPCAEPKTIGSTGEERHLRHTVSARELVERALRGAGDAGLAVARARGARRAVRARLGSCFGVRSGHNAVK